jgi:hypothetical protein
MTDAKIVGGSEADRSKLLELHEEYLVANGKFDWPAIKPLWSEEPHATFFNLNGHTYKGAEHWSRLWAFYIKNVKGSYWTPFDIGGEIKGDMAVIWCHRHSQRNWDGGRAAARHPLPGPGLRQPLDDGVPQGERPVARDPRPFLGGRFGRAAGRSLKGRRDRIIRGGYPRRR